MLNNSKEIEREQEKLDLYSEYISVGLFKELDLRRYCMIDLTIFEDVDIINCILDEVILSDPSFCKSYLYYSSFRKAHLKKADFNHATLDYADFTEASLIECRLSNTDCNCTIFKNADISDSNLSNVYFFNNDFRGAILRDVDISNSSFYGTILMEGITLDGVSGIDKAYFECINVGTIENPILFKYDEAKDWFLKNNHI